jgi:hypothetical protein
MRPRLLALAALLACWSGGAFGQSPDSHMISVAPDGRTIWVPKGVPAAGKAFVGHNCGRGQNDPPVGCGGRIDEHIAYF